MSLILDGTNGLSDVDGSAATPAIRGTDANTGIFFPAADTIAFSEGGVESMRVDSAGNLGLSVTPSPWGLLKALQIQNASFAGLSNTTYVGSNVYFDGSNFKYISTAASTLYTLNNTAGQHQWSTAASGTAGTNITYNQAMTLDASGNLLVGTTSGLDANMGFRVQGFGTGRYVVCSSDGLFAAYFNRNTDDGTIVSLRQAGTEEGTISVSGTTVSYNGGHLSRWSQLLDGSKDDAILKGTVMSNLDDMCVWEKDGVVAENEQLNKMKVSDVEGDTNVAGVFVNWTIDADYGVDDMNVAMTGDMIIRIADGVVVQKGDLLMSAGDGTAKPQGDDIVRSKTIAKVTSNYVTCTYADGSYCVPCVLMAC
jgi:hypothetical protein